jgi:exonuclease III
VEWNIRKKLNSERQEIQNFLQSNKIDIIFFTETELKHVNENAPIKYNGYATHYPKLKNNDSKARIICLVKNKLSNIVSSRQDLMSDTFPSIWLEIKKSPRASVLLCGLYREWDQDGDKDIESQMDRIKILSSQVEAAVKQSQNIIIMGDMNICCKKWNSNDFRLKRISEFWKSTISENGIELIDVGDTYFADHPTPSGEYPQSSLDHIYISKMNIIQKAEKIHNSLTDHYPIYCDLKFGKVKEKPQYIYKRSFKKFNQNLFNSDLCEMPWEKLAGTEQVSEMVTLYETFINTVLDKHAPMKKIKIHEHYKSGISANTKRLMKKRDETRKEFAKATGEERTILHKKYKCLRNKCTSSLRKENKASIKNQIDKADNPSEIWKISNNILNPKTKHSLTLSEEGKEIKNDKEIANIFNKYFIEKISNLRDRISANKEDPLKKLKEKYKQHKPHFSLKTVTENQVRKIIKESKNKKSHGIDKITMSTIKGALNVLITPITHIVNTSITQGQFPEQWKMAKVIPLLKKGDPKNKTNYRPISLLPVTSKILEAVVRKQVSKFFETNDLLPKQQHGFRPGRSTTTALISLQEKLIKSYDQGESTAMLLWDLSAAFDTLDHDIFLEKLKIYGFDQTSRNWFQSFLTGRKQAVYVGEASSSIKTMPWGSPQGAILSPLIFTIFMADIELWVSQTQILGYADDTSSYVSDKKMSNACRKLEEDSENILKFMEANYLIANPSKTKLMIFTKEKRENKITLKIGNTSIEETKEEKLLGITISNDLTWHKHINEVINAINQRTMMLRRLTYSIPRENMGVLAQGLILSKIRYALPVYGRMSTNISDPINQEMHALEVKVNNIRRVMTGNKLSDRVPNMVLQEQTGIPSVNQMLIQSTLLETWKILNGHSESLEELLSPISTNGSIRTRAEERRNLRVPRSHSNKTSFAIQAANIWNLSPETIRDCTTIMSAKREIKKFTGGFH